jgi:hypothetical protein
VSVVEARFDCFGRRSKKNIRAPKIAKPPSIPPTMPPITPPLTPFDDPLFSGCDAIDWVVALAVEVVTVIGFVERVVEGVKANGGGAV